MDDKFIEAIKSDNLDVFRLLFDYKRILLNILEKDDINDFYQLMYEVIETYKWFFWLKEYDYKNYEGRYPYLDTKILLIDNMKDNIRNELIKLYQNLYNNDTFEFKYSKNFKHLYDPKLFLLLGYKYNSVNIIDDYISDMTFYFHRLWKDSTFDQTNHKILESIREILTDQYHPDDHEICEPITENSNIDVVNMSKFYCELFVEINNGSKSCISNFYPKILESIDFEINYK